MKGKISKEKEAITLQGGPEANIRIVLTRVTRYLEPKCVKICPFLKRHVLDYLRLLKNFSYFIFNTK